MLKEARKRANAANEPYRARIVDTKRRLGSRITDMPARFASITRSVEAQIEEIVQERAQGIQPVPDLDFDQLDQVTEEQKHKIRQRGCLVIRNVFEDQRVADWNRQLEEYLTNNNYIEKVSASGAVDDYFSTLASDKPQIYGVYWSRPQMEARTSPANGLGEAIPE